jgi:hypothetical protein
MPYAVLRGGRGSSCPVRLGCSSKEGDDLGPTGAADFRIVVFVQTMLTGVSTPYKYLKARGRIVEE